MKGNISYELLHKVKRGVRGLPSETRDVMKSFILSRMEESGAFMGKAPGADLYYTAFGWLLSSCFGVMPKPSKTAEYLSTFDPDSLDLIHYAAFIKCHLLSKIGKGSLSSMLKAAISRLPSRRPESFSAFPGDDPESPYSLFMLLNISQDCFGFNLNPTEVLSSLERYRTGEGLYGGVEGGSSPSVQSTCCALVLKGYLEGFRKEAAEGLRSLQKENGGFKANGTAPVADLLSTAVALFTLSLYGVKPAFNAFDFIEAHLLDDGSFSSTVLDEDGDIEYLFYGLLSLGCI
ncbi:MAG: hypothetical protein IJ584_12435 [Bacteroidales bacterium]|nr:hypothetical protein [Bacteroidales bacterium]